MYAEGQYELVGDRESGCVFVLSVCVCAPFKAAARFASIANACSLRSLENKEMHWRRHGGLCHGMTKLYVQFCHTTGNVYTNVSIYIYIYLYIYIYIYTYMTNHSGRHRQIYVRFTSDFKI